jgi:hypothetical protein
MDETIEIEVTEQIGSSSKVVSRTGSSDPCGPCFIQTTKKPNTSPNLPKLIEYAHTMFSTMKLEVIQLRMSDIIALS